jgi:hypothetical protein
VTPKQRQEAEDLLKLVKLKMRQRRLGLALCVLAAFGAGYWVRLLTTPVVVIDFAPHHPQQSERL